MYKQLLVCAGLMLSVFSASACDVCGCSSGGGFTGIMPLYHRHFVGVRYAYRSFWNNHPTTDGSKLVSLNRFHTTDVWARIYPHKRVQLFAVVPFNYNTETESGTTVRAFGLGDIQVWANYALVLTPDSSKSSWRHTLLAGAGIKTASGMNNAKNRVGDRLGQSLQPGTGSWDALLNAVYTVRYKKWGMNTDATVRITTANRQGFRFGTHFSGSAKFFYWAKYRNWSFLPQMGLLADYGLKDRNAGKRVEDSGGFALLGTAGVDVYFKRFVFGTTFQQPVASHLGDGNITPRQRYSANFAVLF